MSSIGSVSSIEKSLIYKQKLQHFHTPGFSVFQGRIPCSFRIKCLFHKVYNGESFLRFSMNNKDIHSAIFVSKSKILRAVKEPATEGENEDDTEDAVKATIEKSRKVLAMQKDLLQQIAERKKLVSAIKSSIANADGEVISYSENDNDILYKDVIQDSTNGELDRENLTRIVSDGFSDAEKSVTSDELQIEKDPNKDEHKEITSSNVKFLDVTKESIFLPTKSKAAPSITREIVSSSIKEDEEPKASDDLAEIDSSNEKEEAKPPPLAGKNVMNIIVVAAECAPWSKTGGLGDVAGSLPKALARRGHRVMVVAPRYGNYSEPKETGIYKKYMVDGQEMEVSYFQAYIDDVDFVFIDSGVFQNREKNIYGGERVEILKRMTLFCKAAVEVPWHVPCGGVCYGDGNLVFIANDWHTALLPVYLKAYYRDNGLMNYTRSVLVIHNIAHQGRGPVDDFRYVDLPEHYRDLFTLSDPIGGDHFNIFAAGLKTADRIVTVSNGYSWELKTSEGGWGLHQIINENNWKFRGIVNGIDTKEWNPELDMHLKSDDYTNYTLDTLQTGKPKCKAALQKELGLPIRSEVPLIGFIGRLDHQKGVDLIAEAIPWMLGQDVQLVMLGTGRSDLEDLLRQFERQNHDKIRSWVGFSVRTAHRITAGADILLMPSRFEPCGLNQLYAMMYGTIPVVHAVGGLRDTVQPFDPYKESGFGWTFDRAETPKLIHALGNCLLTYREFKNSWKGLQTRGMTQDLSWDKAAQLYEEELIAAKYQW